MDGLHNHYLKTVKRHQMHKNDIKLFTSGLREVFDFLLDQLKSEKLDEPLTKKVLLDPKNIFI